MCACASAFTLAAAHQRIWIPVNDELVDGGAEIPAVNPYSQKEERPLVRIILRKFALGRYHLDRKCVGHFGEFRSDELGLSSAVFGRPAFLRRNSGNGLY